MGESRPQEHADPARNKDGTADGSDEGAWSRTVRNSGGASLCALRTVCGPCLSGDTLQSCSPGRFCPVDVTAGFPQRTCTDALWNTPDASPDLAAHASTENKKK